MARTRLRPRMKVLGRSWLAVLPLLTLGVVDCYSQGDGSSPPLDKFYFPVGLQVSAGGNVLYAINSDFDLQYNGGTIQSYDLDEIREHAVYIIHDPNDLRVPLFRRSVDPANPCPSDPPTYKNDGSGTRQPLGETCAPPVDSRYYVRDVGVVGAFATDLLLSPVGTANRHQDRLFAPVRGNASLTWATVARDDFGPPSPGTRKVLATDPPDLSYAPFRVDCGQASLGRCDKAHQVGTDPAENSRGLTMPGEPFGIAMSEDSESLVITHQNDPKTSLFSTGLSKTRDDVQPPALEFVLDGMPLGGIGVATVPHDPDLGITILPSFLETTRATPEVDLLRRYPDQVGSVGTVGAGTSLRRPFLDREAVFPITVSANGVDSRGIAIDPTPRIACKARGADKATCARKAARVFIANRSPAALLVGEVGGTPDNGAAYDPDRLTIHTSIPLSAGPSRVYLAPIVDRDGAYSLRVFVVCFDSATIFVYDPDAQVIENVIRVAPGPFAMAFDPFNWNDVASRAQVSISRPDLALRSYRFAYVASFTESFVQLLDLDNAQADRSTYERIVFTLGAPTQPKGS
jgi:hypothetical protein